MGKAVTYRLTRHGIDKASKKITGVAAVFSDDSLALQIMASKPNKGWTAKGLARELGVGPSSIVGDANAFATRILGRLARGGLATPQNCQPKLSTREGSVRLISRKPSRITPKTPRLRR